MEFSDYLNNLIFPAFIVRNGEICQANIPAMQRGMAVGCKIDEFIAVGKEEYHEFTQGKLCLSLNVGGISYNANVSFIEDVHLFSLETEYADPQLRVLALAAQQLREPLSNAFASTEQLHDTLAENDASKAQLAQINRSLHQLLRMVSNMSDTALYNANQISNFETVELVAYIGEVLEKASHLAEKANKKLTYSLPSQKIFSLADSQKLERGILNMLSNALRFSPDASTISTNLRIRNNR